MKEETTVSLAAADNTDDEVSADAAAFNFFNQNWTPLP